MKRQSGNKNKGPAHNRFIHGFTGTPTYKTWTEMKARCLNPSNDSYPNWGGRGITICTRWMKFENFLADMNVRPAGMTIERIDNNGNYEPSNCRWATPKQQARNTRRNRLIKYKGITKTLIEWAEIMRISPSALRGRIDSGMSAKKALETPINKSRVRNWSLINIRKKIVIFALSIIIIFLVF